MPRTSTMSDHAWSDLSTDTGETAVRAMDRRLEDDLRELRTRGAERRLAVDRLWREHAGAAVSQDLEAGWRY